MTPLELLQIPIWREGSAALERAALRRDPVLRGQDVPRGDGAPVLLVPGFLAGDASLAPMAGWLRRIGYCPCRARIRANVDCAGRALDRLELALQRHCERHRRKVTIIGQSRGGTMARMLAVRRPDLIERIICLGSPLSDELAVHPLVRAQVATVAVLGSIGVPGFFSRGCGRGDCCRQAREDLAAPLPPGVGFVSIYSRADGIVDWRTCLDPAAQTVEVRSTHIGMAWNPEVLRVVGRVLAEHDALAATG